MSARVAAMVLADYGTTVVELHDPREIAEPGWETAEQVWTRGKMRVALEDASRLAALLSEADVFITDWHTAGLRALDALPAALRYRFPALVAVRISGYGANSPREGEDWSEALVAASLGLPWAQQGPRGERSPHAPAFAAGSTATAFNAVTAAMAALYRRHRSGEGQCVDIALVDGFAAQQTLSWAWSPKMPRNERDPLLDIDRGSLGRLVLRAFRCSDGGWIHIHTGAKGAFSRLMKLAGIDDRVPPLPLTGQSEIGQPIEPGQLALVHETLPRLFAGRPRAEWLHILRDIDVSAMPDLRAGEVFGDPQVLENQLTTLVDLPGGERVRAAGAPLKYSETPGLPGMIPATCTTTADAIAELRSVAPPVARSRTAPPSGAAFPLGGLKALDFGIHFAGPFATRLLADLGAEVIKLENLFGCPLRAAMNGRMFNAGNRNKRMLAMNLKRPEARAVIERLVASVDIVHHNMRPGVAEELGMSYEDLRRINPKLIYCHSPAYGSLGPWRDLPGFEPLSSAVAGLLTRCEGSDRTGPYLGIGGMDPGNGMMGAMGLLMALHHRDRTGEGQFLECPQLGSAVLSTSEVVLRGDGRISDPMFAGPLQFGYSWHARLYQAADGWLVVDASSPAARAALLGLADATEAHAADQLAAWFAERSVDAATGALRSAGVPATALAPPYDGERFFHDPEHRRLGRVSEHHGHPFFGEYHELGQFWRFPEGRLRTGDDAWFAWPVGAQSMEILRELGLSPGEIEGLVAAKVVGG